MKRRICATLAMSVVLSGLIASPAHADGTTPASVDVMQAIAESAPSSLQGVATDISSDGDSAIDDTNHGVTVDVPVDASNGISVTGGAGSDPITVGLPTATTASDAKTVSSGIVSYGNGNGSETVPLVKTDGSLQINTVINGPSAPSSYSYSISVPSGSALTTDDNGAVSVTDGSGNWVAGLSAPWAKDANGQAVSTHFMISGSTLTQVVDLSSTSIAYPVVADPWLWRDTIDHTTWSYAVPGDPRLQVFPTSWGRAWAGVAVWGEQWGEVKSKTSSHRDWVDTNEMKWQFECHLALGANYWKSSYNLDTTGRRGSLGSYIANKCN